jgi:hypothetical protein
MLFKLIKELPWMFVITLVIWLFALVIVVKKRTIKTSLVAIIIALVLTVFDIWLFVQFIPTHFRKKNTAEQVTLTVNDLSKDSTTADTTTKTIIPSKTKDTSSAKKIIEAKPAVKIYTTNKASIHFFSSTTAEDIEATNSNAVSALNTQTGDIRFIALIKGFHFENELMQDHFNSADYMNSDAFPKSEFKGTITNINTIDFTKDGSYTVNASGNLSIHGVTQKVTASGTLTNNKGKVNLKSIFKIKRADYGITTNEISETLEITVISKYD